jgi:plasmid maintenance system antidote protein VapI
VIDDDVAFNPDWTVCPGRTLQDLIDERGLTLPVLAAMSGITETELEDVLAAKPLSNEFASKLATATGTSEVFWLNRELLYRVDLFIGRTDVS